MTTTNTTDSTTLPPSMEIAGGIVAERCYTDRQLHQKLLDDPMEAISSLLSEHTEKPVNLKEALPNCKVHPLQNTSNRWHIVLPFEYHGETPSKENGLLSEEDLEEVVGGIFLISSTAGVAAAVTGTTIYVVAGTATGTLATTSTMLAMYGGTLAGIASTFLSTGVIAGITAGVVAGGVALTTGITLAAIGGMDAAGIIDAF